MSLRPSAHALIVLLLGCKGMSEYETETGDEPDTDVAGDADTDADGDSDADTDADADADTDADADLLHLRVQNVVPGYASNGGGDTVTITGDNFDASASVYFIGGSATAEATDVTVVSATELTVTVPPSSDVGTVDVKVVTDTHQGTGNGKFRYYEDGTGQYGLIGGLEWYHWVGTYWSTTPEDEGSAFLFFTEPTDANYGRLYYADALDTCTRNFEDITGWDDLVQLTPGMPSVRIAFPGGTQPLTLDQDVDDLSDADTDVEYPFFYSNTLRAEQYVQAGTYDLELINTEGFPRFDLPGLAHAPESFHVTAPAITGTAAPSVRATMQVTWSANPDTSANSYMVLELMKFAAGGGTVEERVTCMMRDDGSFSVPGATWQDWQADRQITIVIGRVYEDGSTLPYNNAQSGMVGAYYVIGAAWSTL